MGFSNSNDIVSPENPMARPNPAARRLSLRRRLLFTLVTLGLLFVTQEVCFRIVFPMPEVDGFNRNNYNPIALTGDRLKEAREKGTSNLILQIDSEPDGYTYNHTLNMYGFRGDNFPIDPTRDRPRVLFIGDSFVEGMGTDDNSTIPRQFVSSLKSLKQVEAINLGLNGIGFSEYVRMVRDTVPLLRPETVFLVVFANDLPAPPYPEDADAPPPALSRNNRSGVRAVEVIRRLKQGKPVPRFYHSGPFRVWEPVPSPNNLWTTGEGLPKGVDPALIEVFRRGAANPCLPIQAVAIADHLREDFTKSGGVDRHLRRITSICRDSGSRLVVVYIPFYTNVNSAYLPALTRLGYHPTDPDGSMESPAFHAQQLHLRDVTDSLGIPFLDLTQEYIEAEKSRGRMFWAYDGHCNAAGYQVAAAACARFWNHGARPRRNLSVESRILARSTSPTLYR